MDGERTIYAGLHFYVESVRDKLCQDVEYYNLKAFFGILPKSKNRIIRQSSWSIDKFRLFVNYRTSIVVLTEKGRKVSTLYRHIILMVGITEEMK